MRVRITIEVDVSETQPEYYQGMTPAECWLCDYDLLWQVKGHGNGGTDEVITLVSEEVV